jgi:energy-coupling factor transporter ATP-binding protein EcfA2
MATLCGRLLILRGDSGSGKTTLVQTLGLFIKGVETVSIRRDELVREVLRSLTPLDGPFRVVVIESREALSDTSDVEIEAILLAVNTFVRTRAGERSVVAWPCNSDPIAEKLAATAGQVGGDALLGVEEPIFRHPGPPKSEYLRIARNLIATFNSGASLADLGISEERALQLAREAETIGKFLNLLQLEERDSHRIGASGAGVNDQEASVW